MTGCISSSVSGTQEQPFKWRFSPFQSDLHGSLNLQIQNLWYGQPIVFFALDHFMYGTRASGDFASLGASGTNPPKYSGMTVLLLSRISGRAKLGTVCFTLDTKISLFWNKTVNIYSEMFLYNIFKTKKVIK